MTQKSNEWFFWVSWMFCQRTPDSLPTLSNSVVQHNVCKSQSGGVQIRLHNMGSNIQPTCLSGGKQIAMDTRTDIPFDHHNLDKTVSKFISQRKSNILVSSSYTPQMRSFSLSQSVSSNNHLPSNSTVHPQEKVSSEGPWVTRSSESVGNWRLCIVIFHTILPSRRAAHL